MNENRHVLIVGGSGGIGSAVARQCASEGAWPVVGYRSRADHAKRVVAECGRGEIVHVDLQSREFQQVQRLRQVDAIVHAAGLYLPRRDLLTTTDDEFDLLIKVNMLGPMRLIRALLEWDHQVQDVIFVLSTASFGRGGGPYALSKIGELGVCKLLANELAPRGTRVNAIAPGWTDTPMAARAADAAGLTLDEVRARHLGLRILTPDQIGKLCANLLFHASCEDSGRLAVWDRRDSPDPVWLRLEAAFACESSTRSGPVTSLAE
jgi:3-oxoacyl-[acyl-carrier protein] reductase